MLAQHTGALVGGVLLARQVLREDREALVYARSHEPGGRARGREDLAVERGHHGAEAVRLQGEVLKVRQRVGIEQRHQHQLVAGLVFVAVQNGYKGNARWGLRCRAVEADALQTAAWCPGPQHRAADRDFGPQSAHIHKDLGVARLGAGNDPPTGIHHRQAPQERQPRQRLAQRLFHAPGVCGRRFECRCIGQGLQSQLSGLHRAGGLVFKDARQHGGMGQIVGERGPKVIHRQRANGQHADQHRQPTGDQHQMAGI